MKERLEKELDGIRDAGTWKTERVITSKQDVSINVQGSQGKILNFCANNYLGLSVSLKGLIIKQIIKFGLERNSTILRITFQQIQKMVHFSPHSTDDCIIKNRLMYLY